MQKGSSVATVISAFLDDEPFEPEALVAALADPAGRDLLIDLIAVRGMVKLETPSPTALLPPRRSSRLSVVLASAAVVIAWSAAIASAS